jgi:hypothetical protein
VAGALDAVDAVIEVLGPPGVTAITVRAGRRRVAVGAPAGGADRSAGGLCRPDGASAPSTKALSPHLAALDG